jgi:drug/metabolite transporter (DMT)-like permease
LGVLLAAIGALSYGVTVVVGEDLADAGLGSSTALGVRFLISGVMLAFVLRLRGRRVLASRRQVVVGLALGLAYAVEATLYFSALERGTAAAVALVVYVYPALVLLYELLRGNERATVPMVLAVVLSTTGMAVVVVGGGEVALTPAGLAFALGSAATFAAYLLVGRDLTRNREPMGIACFVAIGAGVVNLARGAVTAQLANPSDRLLELVLYGAATAVAFTLTFAAMNLIGAARVAVVMTLEAVSSVIMAAVFLGESVRPGQALGGVMVLGAAIVIARGQPAGTPTAIEAAPAAGT